MHPLPRLAMWADESLHADDGYQVACCETDQAGYWIVNRGWATLDQARQFATEQNAHLGHTGIDTVVDVRASSLRASDLELT